MSRPRFGPTRRCGGNSMPWHFCLLSLRSLLGCEPCPKPKSPPCDSPCVLRTVRASSNPDNFFGGTDSMSVCDCRGSGATMGSSDGLQALSFSSAPLTPAFAASATNYTLALASPSASLTVTAAVGQPSTNVLSTAAWWHPESPSAPLLLQAGSQPVIQILVTAAKQSTKAYTVNVHFEIGGLEISERRVARVGAWPGFQLVAGRHDGGRRHAQRRQRPSNGWASTPCRLAAAQRRKAHVSRWSVGAPTLGGIVPTSRSGVLSVDGCGTGGCAQW